MIRRRTVEALVFLASGVVLFSVGAIGLLLYGASLAPDNGGRLPPLVLTAAVLLSFGGAMMAGSAVRHLRDD